MREEDLKQDTEIFSKNIFALSSFDLIHNPCEAFSRYVLNLEVNSPTKQTRNSRWSFFDH